MRPGQHLPVNSPVMHAPLYNPSTAQVHGVSSFEEFETQRKDSAKQHWAAKAEARAAREQQWAADAAEAAEQHLHREQQQKKRKRVQQSKKQAKKRRLQAAELKLLDVDPTTPQLLLPNVRAMSLIVQRPLCQVAD